MLNTQIFSERLEFILKHYEITSAILADKINVQRSSISHLLSGRNNPSLDFVIKLLDYFPEINFDWLVKGKGPFFKNESDNSAPLIKKTEAPTLFDQVFEKNKTVKRHEESAKNEILDKKISSLDKKIKPIDKILVLYKDGSFDSYI